MKLASWAQEMRRLDFSGRFEVERDDEIGVLGQSMNELSDKLEQTISELKAANIELQHDIEKKAEQEQMRREFLANVSHELKTPIALIQGYAEGLKENISDDPESRDFYCEVIVDEADKMNQMVKKLLSLNQLEFGKTEFTMVRFDIVGFVEGCLQNADMLAKKKEIRVKIQKRPPLYVWADEFWTEEVFMNYFSNAVNHCNGKKVIDIHFEEKQNCVRVVVFNTGSPIPEESLPHLWEKFYKVDKARTREYGGSGVGLSIVKAIMDQMHQDYGVINYDNGVAFWFELEKDGQAKKG
jgi:signal transduction histidine kinase